jgi:hypothetical protein
MLHISDTNVDHMNLRAKLADEPDSCQNRQKDTMAPGFDYFKAVTDCYIYFYNH